MADSRSSDAEVGRGGSLLEPCTRVKSTLLLGSLRVLRARGHADRYRAFAGEPFYERLLLATGAPTWVPIAEAHIHYAACDALALPADEVLQIGMDVAPVSASGSDVLIRAARAGGLSPWSALERMERYWGRMYDGSSARMVKQGPKDARVVITGQPLATSRYWRVGLRGIAQALASALSEKAYVRELPSRPNDGVTYEISWV